MATKSRRKSTSLSEKLFSEPYRFSFFQATRLLQGIVRNWRNKTSCDAVGHDLSPLNEVVKFKAFPSLKFASSEIAKIDKTAASRANRNPQQADMQVSFIGLTGQSSALPVHFTELEIIRTREKDHALKQFYDLFNHRAISFFYRAWEKYRLPYAYERTKLDKATTADPITLSLQSLLGINGDALQKKLDINPEDMLFYAGLFATPNRSAASLSDALGEILDVPVVINQFKGEWMTLLQEDRMRLPLFPLSGQNNCLGVDTVIGDEVFTVEGKFQLEIGPLSKKNFDLLQPGTIGYNALKKFTRLFVGDGFDFEMKYMLQNDAVDAWTLNTEENARQGLGLNTWLLPENLEDAKKEIIVGV